MELSPLNRTAIGSLKSRAHAGVEGADRYMKYMEDNALVRDFQHFNWRLSVVRSNLIDVLVMAKLSFGKNPPFKIINLGCGFCTRFSRLNPVFLEDDPRIASWVDVDQPAVIEVREEVEADNLNDVYSLMAMDVNQMDLDIISEADLLIAEGLLCYIPEERAKELVGASKHAIFDVLGCEREIPKGPDQLWLWNPENWSEFNINHDKRFAFAGRDDRVIETLGQVT